MTMTESYKRIRMGVMAERVDRANGLDTHDKTSAWQVVRLDDLSARAYGRCQGWLVYGRSGGAR